MHSRMLYMSCQRRCYEEAQRYDFDSHLIRTGDYLFKAEYLQPHQVNLFKSLTDSCGPYLRLLFETQKTLLFRLIPDPLFISELGGYKSDDLQIDLFFKNVVRYFTHSGPNNWKFDQKEIEFSKSPVIMGILNVTPDSFSDGGLYFEEQKAIDHAMNMIEKGVDIIDIGGESTRPGAERVNLDEEISRVITIIDKLRKISDILLSVDTYKSAVAKEALKRGVKIINDISGMIFDPRMQEVISEFDCHSIVMHMKGNPQNMQVNPSYRDVSGEIYSFMDERLEYLKSAQNKTAIDPGIGFGKSVEHNLTILRDLKDFTFLGKPIVVGASRKSFLGKLLNKDINQRLVGTIIAQTLSVMNDANILRVHDVPEAVQIKTLFNTISRI